MVKHGYGPQLTLSKPGVFYGEEQIQLQRKDLVSLFLGVLVGVPLDVDNL